MNISDYYIYNFSSGVICSFICTFLIRKWALEKGIVNTPNPIVMQHTLPVAYLGGIGVFGGLIITYAIEHFIFREIFFKKEYLDTFKSIMNLSVCSVCFLTLGVYDDLKTMKPLPKFCCQLMVTIFCVSFGIRGVIFNNDTLDFILSVVWILIVINAVNFTDVCDGLITSISAIIFLMCGLFLPQTNLLCFIISGTLFGFFFFNAPKASIFQGDAGSHLIGFLISAITLSGTKTLKPLDAIIWMIFVCDIFLFELIFITIVRIKKGKPWWKGSPDHFSLRLQKAGFTRWQIIFVTGLITAISVYTACKIQTVLPYVKYVELLPLIILCKICWKFLLKWEVN